MDSNQAKLLEIQMNICKEALENRGFHAWVSENVEQAKALIQTMIPDGAVVCDGGSMTLKESGIIEMLNERSIQYHSHNDPMMSREESDREARKAFSADVFLASANAVTLDGEIINVDGHGNRVSAMIFGPKKVILVVGCNKLVKDEQAARVRMEQIAAPANAIRLHKAIPCASQGHCMDCRSKDRICSSYVKLNYDKENRIHVILVKQPLGY